MFTYRLGNATAILFIIIIIITITVMIREHYCVRNIFRNTAKNFSTIIIHTKQYLGIAPIKYWFPNLRLTQRWVLNRLEGHSVSTGIYSQKILRNLDLAGVGTTVVRNVDNYSPILHAVTSEDSRILLVL